MAATLELLRDRGIANLTTREVAARAGVSDASVYYHFRDRAGLLQCVFATTMQPLAYLSTLSDDERDRVEVLTDAARALERFFDEALPVLIASQSDPELREAFAQHLCSNDLGPHKGVQALGVYLRNEQASGRVDPEVDVDAAAMLLIDNCLGRAMRKQMRSYPMKALPTLEQVVQTINRLLERPPG